MSQAAELPQRSNLARRVRLLSWITLLWLAIDGVIGMTAGLAANSVALIGWGLDCAIQSAAALVVVWRFGVLRLDSDEAEDIARRVVAVSFFLLVPYIVAVSLNQLLTGEAGAGSWIGVILAATDAVLMPFLGSAKKRLGAQLNSQATTGVGKQNILCAYLSVAVLVGLSANLLFGIWWADPIAALLIAVACLQAGWSTWRREACEGDSVATC